MAWYKHGFQSPLLTDSDLEGQGWVVMQLWEVSALHPGEAMNYRPVVWCRSTELCPSATLHLPLPSSGKLPQPNFLTCKIGDNNGVYCIGLLQD